MKPSGYIILLYLFCFTACEDMNSLHQEYWDRGEEIYTGVIDSLKAFPGDNRVKFTWQINSDPRITKIVIYWDEGMDSVIVNVTRTQTGTLNMETLFNIPEGSYIFEFVTKDDEGHRSLSTERTVEIYGEKYASLLRNRVIKSMNISEGNNLRIMWFPVETTVQYTTISYVDYTDPGNPVQRNIRVENADTETALAGTNPGETFSVITSHLPAGSLDIFDALPREYVIK
ncbi:MAG: DUF4998 domain-containing protein [Mangrovibacterium sp.]